MSATIATAPPARALSQNPIWVELETDEISLTYAYFEITISGAGPSAAETLTLTWPGGSITYTVAASISQTGTNWPTKGGGESLEDYTNRIAEFLRHREDVAEVFYVTVENAAGGIIRLTHPVPEAFDLTVTTDTMTNVAVTASDGSAYTLAENLRAYLEVWTDTGDFNDDERLLALHSPYNVDDASTQIDISAAFAHLKPHLPDAGTIEIGFSISLDTDVASDAFQKYYLRYADKYGAPAVAEALLKSDDSYLAILGALSGDSLHPQVGDLSAEPYLRHNYRRRFETYDPFLATDTQILRRPVTDTQPDWVYALLYDLEGTVSDVYVECLLYWSDGTQSVRQPYDTDPTAIDPTKIHWFPSGYRQMKLHLETPPGADPDAYIVAYDWKLMDEATDVMITSVAYSVHYLQGWNYYVLFSNGLGGCETACFRGKAVERFKTEASAYRKVRRPEWSVDQHETQTFAHEGQREWELNTGWTTDADWLEHLRQLSLSPAAWLIEANNDLFENERFLAVTVETRDIETKKDDETLFQLTLTIRAAWVDVAANV